MKLVLCVILALSLTALTTHGQVDDDEEIREIEDTDTEDLEEDAAGQDAEIDDEHEDLGLTLPEALDLREKGVVHHAIYQGGCPSCGWISGTQTLEARIALVSENYVPYSIQNFMQCAGKVCKGTQPYSVTSHVRNRNYVVEEKDMKYNRKDCKKTKTCQCGTHFGYDNVLNDQFVVVSGTRKVKSEEHLKQALQSGPVTTCFGKAKRIKGTCQPGCKHANSIVGYTKDSYILQESTGPKWGPFKDGSWRVPMGSPCAEAIVKKAYHPSILYDYDRANAYFEEMDDLVSMDDLKEVDEVKWGITLEDKTNIGRAKNKCALLGSKCKGVVTLPSGGVVLVTDFGASAGGTLEAVRKVQMVVYLKSEATGRYIKIIKKKKGKKRLSSTKDKKDAAAFFTSYSRFISFDYPNLHLVRKGLEAVTNIPSIDVMKSWTLKDCNLQNVNSRTSLDVEKEKITGSQTVLNSKSQRFNVGVSGKWTLFSRSLKKTLGANKEGDMAFVEADGENSLINFQWNARQILHISKGKALNSKMEISDTPFDLDDMDLNAIQPTDCVMSQLIPTGSKDNLVMNGEGVKMDSSENSRWTLEYEKH